MAQAHEVETERNTCRICHTLLDYTERTLGICDECAEDDRDADGEHDEDHEED